MDREIIDRFKLEYVLWNDSWTSASGWADSEDLDSADEKELVIASVGFLIYESEKWITLAADLDTNHESFSHNRRMSIPKGCIIARHTIDLETYHP